MTAVWMVNMNQLWHQLRDCGGWGPSHLLMLRDYIYERYWLSVWVQMSNYFILCFIIKCNLTECALFLGLSSCPQKHPLQILTFLKEEMQMSDLRALPVTVFIRFDDWLYSVPSPQSYTRWTVIPTSLTSVKWHVINRWSPPSCTWNDTSCNKIMFEEDPDESWTEDWGCYPEPGQRRW